MVLYGSVPRLGASKFRTVVVLVAGVAMRRSQFPASESLPRISIFHPESQ
jgi:hypothetical protein